MRRWSRGLAEGCVDGCRSPLAVGLAERPTKKPTANRSASTRHASGRRGAPSTRRAPARRGAGAVFRRMISALRYSAISATAGARERVAHRIHHDADRHPRPGRLAHRRAWCGTQPPIEAVSDERKALEMASRPRREPSSPARDIRRSRRRRSRGRDATTDSRHRIVRSHRHRAKRSARSVLAQCHQERCVGVR